MKAQRLKTAATCLVLLLVLPGCVERMMTITSNPAGALVEISDVEKGRTPLKIPFTWYGDYEVRVTLDGYEQLETGFNVKPPWYDVPPLDLFSEVAPWTYRVDRSAHYELRRRKLPSDADLLKRAQEIRKRNEQGS